VEIAIERVFLAQKRMISKCNAVGKPVITATQMLDSMMRNPRPTRAEATDVANAVLDGSDAVMLSGETAKGDYPVEAVKTMVQICRMAEASLDYRKYFLTLRENAVENPDFGRVMESIASSACKTAIDLESPLILVFTETGNSACAISKYKPPTTVIAVTPNQQTARQLNASSAVFPKLVGSMHDSDAIVRRTIDTCVVNKWVRKGDPVVVVSGFQEGVSGTTNQVQVIIA